MVRNYILIYLRTLLKNPLFFLVNIFGLSVGIAACLLCYLHIRYELSYDQYHSNSDRIYRIVTGDVKSGDGWVKVSAPIPPKLKAEIPEIETFARFARITYDQKIMVRYENNVFNEARFFMGDPALLDIFDIPLVTGKPGEVLTDLNSVIISETVAEKYFGADDPVGKMIRVNAAFDFEVTGVFKSLPFNSHMDFDFLISFRNLERIFPGTSLIANWGQFNYFAYLLLYPESSKSNAEAKINSITVDLGDESEFKLAELGLQPLRDIHFQDNRGNLKPSYNRKYLYIYTAVALAILFISFINFVNLSIAGSTKRVKEVGVRKVIGAYKRQLVYQFISESVIITGISVLFSIFLIEGVLLPATNDLLDSQITTNYSQASFLISISGLIFFISISAGSYIAFFVTSFQPIDALRGSFKIGTKGVGFKNLLLTFQFSISIILILSSIFIYQQLIFLKNKHIGLDKEQVLNIALYNREAMEKAELLKQEFSGLSWVQHVSATRFVPGSANWNQTVWWEGQEEPLSMYLISVDLDILKTLNFELIEGNTNLLENEPKEGEVRYILNESAKNVIGWEYATDQPFSAFGDRRIQPVTGVVRDFNFQSLHHKVGPCVLVVYSRFLPSQLLVKLRTSDYQKALGVLEARFNEVLPGTPFEYRFLDDEFEKLYNAENRTVNIIAFLTVVAIILALLGLYGLLTFAVQERTKEMAIRKILGVSFPDIILLLSGSYLKLLILSNIIAVPVVYIMINQWLNNFNYRIDLSLFVFVLTSLMIWLFVLITISLNVIQVVRIDPVKGLRFE